MMPFNLSDVVQNPGAVSILEAVLDGKISPPEGAKELLHCWYPVEAVNSRRASIPGIQTRPDSLNDLMEIAIFLMNQGYHGESRRLNELNWEVAQLLNVKELKIQCAANLSQVLALDPAAAQRRLDLLEYCVPEIVKGPPSEQAKAYMLANLADARFDLLRGARAEQVACIEACRAALEYSAQLDPGWQARTWYNLGTTCNELGGADELAVSIECLQNAVEIYRKLKENSGLGSALNNLGNSLRDLGELNGEASLLKRAIQCFDQALPYRDSPSQKERTKNNRARAEAILASLHSQSSAAGGGMAGWLKGVFSGKKKPEPRLPPAARPAAPPPDEHLKQIRAYFRSGDNAYQTYYGGKEDETAKEQFLKSAARDYLHAMTLLRRDDTPELKAEGLHRVGLLYINKNEDDESWTGLCLLAATRRRGKQAWQPVSLARVEFHQARMLFTLGYPDHPEYLREGKRLLEHAMPILRSQGGAGESDQVSHIYQMTLALLAQCGQDPSVHEAMEQSYQQQAEERLAKEVTDTEMDEVAEAYQKYFNAVRQEAEGELVKLLGALGAEAAEIFADQGIDEYLHADGLMKVARKYLEAGDLRGALDLMKLAESEASKARYSAPSIWCEIAKFYAGVPVEEDAWRCLDEANGLMDKSEDSGRYIAPPNKERRWYPEGILDEYQKEIDETEEYLMDCSYEPKFDPQTTADRLSLSPGGRRDRLISALRRLTA